MAESGLDVTVVDSGEADRATPCSFSWINASWGQAPHYHAFRLRALDAWDRLIQSRPEIPFDSRGTLYFSFFGEDLAQMAVEQTVLGNQMRVLGQTELAELEPAWRDFPELAVLAVRERSVDAVRVGETLLDSARAHGAKVMTGARVERLALGDGAVTGVVFDGQKIAADETIIAAGRGSDDLLRDVGATVNLTSPAGLLLNTNPQPFRLNHIVLSERIHVRSLADGRLLAGEEFSGKGDLSDKSLLERKIVAAIKDQISGVEDVKIDRTTIGLRPTPGDGFPAIGRLDGVGGLSVAVMHSGITLAPLVAEILTKQINGGIADECDLDFSPNRFSLKE